MDIKVCSKCKEEQFIDNFKFRTDTNKYRNTCKICDSIIKKEYYNNNKDRLQKVNNQYKLDNKEQLIIKNKIYSINNRYKSNNWRKNKYNNDPQFRLFDLYRSRLKDYTNGIRKSKKTKEIIGCSLHAFKLHLQISAIHNGYVDFNIENYSGQDYHIDHIIPVKAITDGNITLEECFHYTNLQILDAKTNIIKSDKY